MLLLSEFTFSCNFSEDLYNIFSRFCKPVAVSERRIEPSADNSITSSTKIDVSTAQCLAPLIIFSASSFMKNENKIGLQKPPCWCECVLVVS